MPSTKTAHAPELHRNGLPSAIVPDHRDRLATEVAARWTLRDGSQRQNVICDESSLLTQRKPQIHPHRLRVRRCAGAAVAERLGVVGEAGGDGVALHPLARFLHQVGEGRQRHELAGGEEVAPLSSVP